MILEDIDKYRKAHVNIETFYVKETTNDASVNFFDLGFPPYQSHSVSPFHVGGLAVALVLWILTAGSIVLA
jgi:hypothetical protein